MKKYLTRITTAYVGAVGAFVYIGGRLLPLAYPSHWADVIRAIVAVAAVLWLVGGLALRARVWRIVDMPVSKVCAAAVGPCEFRGVAQAPRPKPAPGSGIPCVWFHWKLQKDYKRGTSNALTIFEHVEYEAPFWLTDETGTIRVDPANADVEGADFQGLRAAPPPGQRGAWIQYEERIPQGAQVYVVGTVRAEGDELVVGCGPTGDDDFLISHDTTRRLAHRLGMTAWLSTALGLLAAAVATVLVETSQVSPETGKSEADWALRFNVPIITIVALICAVFLTVSWLWRVYNRLVIVRVQAEKAWASIEVQLQRRHDLVENLVTVVKRYAQYERETQFDVATLRANAKLPTDANVRGVNAADAADAGESARLAALAESNAQLKADEEFAKLRATLIDTENRIASSRQFYNDAVTVLRDRRRTFPYLLIARFVRVPSFRLLGDEPAPAAVPSLH